jgi:uncharacterized protein (UPF0335 family)
MFGVARYVLAKINKSGTPSKVPRGINSEHVFIIAEAKGRGYDPKVIRKIVAMRKRDRADLANEEAVTELYKSALGMA